MYSSGKESELHFYVPYKNKMSESLRTQRKEIVTIEI